MVAHRQQDARSSTTGTWGGLTVDHTDLWLGPEAGPRMVTYAPADEESRERLEKLHAIALERALSCRVRARWGQVASSAARAR